MLRFDRSAQLFRSRPWTEIQDRFHEMAKSHPEFRHMADIADSVVECGKTGELAATTSMHDLVVARLPIAEPPVDVVIVSSPSSMNVVAAGEVRIDHLAVTGHDERLERPVADAVPLFWRFMIEKFGVQPNP